MSSLEQSINETSFLGKKLKVPLKKLGIETVKDLVFYFPTRYEDWSMIKKLGELRGVGEATVRVQIKKISNRRSFKSKIYLTEATISDSTGGGTAIWFNQPYLVKNLVTGSIVWLSGKYKSNLTGPSFTSPTYEITGSEQVHTGRIIPIYGSLGGIPQKSFRRIMHDCLRVLTPIKEWLPEETIRENGLEKTDNALQEIHFPTNWKNLLNASKKFKFEELYLLSIRGELARAELLREEATPIKTDIPAIKNLLASLPFKLTESQRRATWEIIQDLARPKPMNRLLDGDVGSGKTAVAAIAAYSVACSGGQTVMMAPTEILAKQHFSTLQKIFSTHGISVGLLTRTAAEVTSNNKASVPKNGREKIIKLLKNDKLQILIGTHALLFERLNFKNLALAIVDEQHRFGVNQRRALQKMGQKEITPHLLSMTATPIPRSLALAFYGDLDISILSEMPLGRKPVKTSLVPKNTQENVYAFIKKEIEKGHQAFVICPLIDPVRSSPPKALRARSRAGATSNGVDPSDTLEVRSATAEYEHLSKKVFPNIKVGLLHGRLKTEEKDKIMSEFKENKISILVSTSVVEVGVDIPNATVMIIEGAERFGLSQLHQFRGRIGRGEAPSSCFVFFENKNPLTYERLKIFAATNDGFTLSEHDLTLRGPGEIFGTAQSGESGLRMATFSDLEIAIAARRSARALIDSDKNFTSFPLLAERLKKMEQTIHLE